MERTKDSQAANAGTVGELKKLIIANAVATGNTYAFQDLFSQLREFSRAGDEEQPESAVLERLQYLLPNEEALASPVLRTALELVGRYDLGGEILPAALLEETARQAVAGGKFAYAEEAYKLLGVKNEIIALYGQCGEQFLRENKPTQGALAFLVAASLEQPVGPHYQYVGPDVHSGCLHDPKKCVTELPLDSLRDEGIKLLLGNEALAQKLLAQSSAEQKPHILGTLASYRDIDLLEFAENIRASVAALLKIENGKPDDYSAIGPLLLGRPTTTNQPWQYMEELCFEHPIAILCVCARLIRGTPVLVPMIRDGKPLLDLLLPPQYTETTH